MIFRAPSSVLIPSLSLPFYSLSKNSFAYKNGTVRERERERVVDAVLVFGGPMTVPITNISGPAFLVKFDYKNKNWVFGYFFLILIG